MRLFVFGGMKHLRENNLLQFFTSHILEENLLIIIENAIFLKIQ